MGKWQRHQLSAYNISNPFLSRSAAKKSKLPIGHFDAYYPDRLCNPGFEISESHVRGIEDAESSLQSFEKQLGPSAERLNWVLQRSESLGSSIIEDVKPSLRRVARAEAVAQLSNDAPQDLVAMEAIGNIKANEKAVSIAEQGVPISLDGILTIHHTLMQHTNKPEIGGVLRDGWVYIGGVLGGYPSPAYVPPPSNEVPHLLEDLIDYINCSDHHPIVVASVAHAQFENIHPFFDGNGRTGRALIQSILRAKGMTQRSVCPISAVLARHKERYVAALQHSNYEGPSGGLRQSESFDAVVELFSDLIPYSCEYATNVIARADAIVNRWKYLASRIRSDSSAHYMINNLLLEFPVFSIEHAARESGVSIQSARKAVKSLQDLGIVQHIRGNHKQYALLEAPDMLDLFKSVYVTEDNSLSVIPQMLNEAKIEDAPNMRASRCFHIGVRAKQMCILRLGHHGPHRYK